MGEDLLPSVVGCSARVLLGCFSAFALQVMGLFFICMGGFRRICCHQWLHFLVQSIDSHGLHSNFVLQSGWCWHGHQSMLLHRNSPQAQILYSVFLIFHGWNWSLHATISCGIMVPAKKK